MTASPLLPDLDDDAETEPELSRITVLVNGLTVDVALPGDSSISTVIGEVIELANDQVPMHSELEDVEFDNEPGNWTFARLGGAAIDPNRSLVEAGIYDGDFLVVQQVGAPAARLLFDDIVTTPGPADSRRRWLRDNSRAATWFGMSILLGAVIAVVLAQQPTNPTWLPEVPIAAIVTLLTGIACAVTACALPYRRNDNPSAVWLAGVALPLIFGGSLYVIPGTHGIAALPMALGLTAVVALLALLVSERARPMYTAVIVVAILCTPAAVAEILFNINARSIGAVLATVAVIVVYLAPRATIAMSKLPVPRVPTAGEPLDDIETQGGPAVEGVNAIGKQIIPTEQGMTDRVRRANEYLTGIIAAAAVVAVIGCYLAVDVSHGFFWQGTAFSIAVATVLCLRGRSHHDLIQSATLIGSGLVITIAMIVKTATYIDSWQIIGPVLLAVLIVLVVLTGLVAPRREFSPVLRRRVEILEYVAIALVFPLACWILRIYAYLRELHL
ncbi:type VII secretion integral membrane protein EccD [Mycolicibacterium fortuitum]|uniref:Type VII secretion integral membrane protein EccD n=2 Tax=Bacteria TaxID=2 RepID=A0A378WF44_MYCFO|nr:type VII secretion integral membrane protein EccD [Mycolicibacterium fortuitum]